MNPQIFHISDQVEIIGPTITGCHCFIGEKFKISSECNMTYSGDGFPWYPTSSLRLVEGLKVGDWVQVIGPKWNGPEPSECGKIFRISGIIGEGNECIFSAPCFPWYKPSSLRKLAPEEIAMHTGTIGYQAQKCEGDLQKAQDAIREILAPLVDGRLSAIEKRQAELDSWMDRFAKVGAAWEQEKADYDCALKLMGQTIGKMQDQIDQMKRAFREACY